MICIYDYIYTSKYRSLVLYVTLIIHKTAAYCKTWLTASTKHTVKTVLLKYRENIINTTGNIFHRVAQNKNHTFSENFCSAKFERPEVQLGPVSATRRTLQSTLVNTLSEYEEEASWLLDCRVWAQVFRAHVQCTHIFNRMCWANYLFFLENNRQRLLEILYRRYSIGSMYDTVSYFIVHLKFG